MWEKAPSILGYGHADPAGVRELKSQPDYRKATTPMVLASCATRDALSRLTPAARELLPQFGLVVGVDHGELEMTNDVLRALEAKGMAQSFLFQNALHNATLGFVATRLGLFGPGLTTSTLHFAGEDALALAKDLIVNGECEACLCVGVEAVGAAMKDAEAALKRPKTPSFSRAGAVLLASPYFAQRFDFAENLRLGAVECEREPGLEVTRPSRADFYGADAIERVASAAAKGMPMLLELTKPDGSRSKISLLLPPQWQG